MNGNYSTTKRHRTFNGYFKEGEVHVKKNKKTVIKEKKLRIVRAIPMIATSFHYGSVLIKQAKLPYSEVIYEFILEHIYNGFLSFLVQPVCEWLWSQSWYEVLYKMSGLPALLLTITLTVLIRMKEKGGKIIKNKTYKSFWDDFGTYRPEKPSLSFRIRNFIRKTFFAEEFNLVEEGMNKVLLRVISDNKELCVNLTQERSYSISNKVNVSYDVKTDTIILKNESQPVKTLRKGDYCEMLNMAFWYL